MTSRDAQPAQTDKLVLVQILRAVAAGLVVVHHAQHEAALLAARTGAAFAPAAWLPWPAGVDVFFVISGFIIVHASTPFYGRADGRRRFAAHRVARLVPLYWLVSAAYLGLGLAAPSVLGGQGGGPDAGAILASFLFVPTARPDGSVLPLYGLGWTLNYEMAFYALFALGLGFGRRGAVAWIALALGALVLAARLVPAPPVPLAFWGDPIVLEFVLGAGLALARAEGLRLGTPARLALAASGLALLAAAPAEPALRPLDWGGPAALLVAAAVLGRDRPDPRGGAFGVRALSVAASFAARLGDASYALYLLHPFGLRAVREALARTGLADWLGPWPSLALMVAFTVPVALVAYALVERPLTRWVRARLDPDGSAKKAVGSDT